MHIRKAQKLLSRLYYTITNVIESYTVINQKCIDLNIFMLWHDHLGHPRSTMMHRIFKNSYGHLLKEPTDLLSN